MTAEVVVMNKEAVALAADSAVTRTYVEQEGVQQKIYNSANKLFKLAKFHPVGIMIFNSAEFMGIPWEIIIKLYREKIGGKRFGMLEEYARDFFTFLESKGNTLIPEGQQKSMFSQAVLSYFIGVMKEDIDAEVQSSFENEPLPLSDELKFPPKSGSSALHVAGE